MKIRTALKICKENFGDRPWETVRLRRYRQVQKAIHLGRRKSNDDRFPYIPSEEELQEQGEILTSIFAGVTLQMFKDKGMEPPKELLDIAMDFSQFDDEAIEKDRRAFLIEGGLNPDDPKLGPLALPEEDFET